MNNLLVGKNRSNKRSQRKTLTAVPSDLGVKLGRTRGCPPYILYVCFDTYLYIYIYICCRVTNWSQKSRFLSQNLVQIFLVFSFFVFCVFCKKFFFLQGKWDFHKKNEQKRQTLPFFESKLGPILLRNILGPKKLRNTICEHNCANWFFCPFFLQFPFGGFCCVRFSSGPQRCKQETTQSCYKNNNTETKWYNLIV